MRLNSSKPHVDERRSRHSSADDVGSGGWKTHAEDQRGDHRQNQRDQKVAVCNLDDKAGKFDTGTRHIQNADNDTGRAAGADHAARGLGAVCHRVQDFLEAELPVFDDVDNDARQNAPGGGADGALIEDGHDNRENNQRQEHVEILKDIFALRELFLRNAGEIVFRRFDVNHQKHGKEVQKSRNDGREHDLGVGRANQFCHNKRGRAQNRGHNLSAGRGGRFDCRSKFGLIADRSHQWDGKRAGRDDVRDGVAGDGAKKSTGDNGDLCRTAALGARQRHGKIDEERSCAGEGQKCAEHHE